jgi:hypothetical protein
MLLVLWHLFVPTVIGTADTGDGLRLLCQIRAGDPHFGSGKSSAERFVAIHYVQIPPNPTACGAFRVTERYPSSALAVLAAAQQLTHLTGSHDALDMRFTGLLYALLYGVVIAVFALVLPGPRLARLAVAAALGVLGADATFAPYFISPFSEPLEYVALLATFAALLALWRRRTVPWPIVVAVTVVFAALVTAKSQDTPLAALLAVVLLTVRCPVGRLTGRWASRVVPAVAALCLLVVGATDVYLQPKLYNQELVYSDVFYTILKDSSNVRADLADLGLPQELARYAGRTYFETRAETAKDPSYRTFVETITFSDVARFYLRHPARLAPVTTTAVEDVVRARHELPNTTSAETATPQVVCRICLIPPVGRALAPVSSVLWPLWELLVLGVGALLARRRWAQREWRALGLLLVTTVVFAAFHTATAILGDGYAELDKHVFPAVVDTWMVVPLVALALYGLVRGRPRSEDGLPSASGGSVGESGTATLSDVEAVVQRKVPGPAAPSRVQPSSGT